MANWNEVLQEIIFEANENPEANDLDTVRKKYLSKISKITGRNTIASYSGWLQSPDSSDTAINDKDKSGFMLIINKLNTKLELDLVLHTPEREIAATESLVDYLFNVSNKDIRDIIPQISMSAGEMIAL